MKGRIHLKKKFWIYAFLTIGAMIVAGCGSDDSAQEVDSVDTEIQDEEVEQDAEENNNAEEEKPVEIDLELNQKLEFEQFDVTIKTVKVYEKDDKLLADIKLDWTNKAQDYGPEMTFYVATLFDVKQGENSLVEINDAWNPENKNTSDVFFPNAVGGSWEINLTYELVDDSTPIEIEFTPTTETEGTETVTIDIKN